LDSVELLGGFAEKNGIFHLVDAPMCDYTSFKIGGPADILLEPDNAEQLKGLIDFCRENGIEIRALGRGSNVLVPDEGVRGAVVRFGSRYSEVSLRDGHMLLCGPGTALAQACRFARDNSLTGLEFAYGIPGSVGGAIFMNAGAYGGEIKDICARADFVDSLGGTGIFEKADLEFSYRHSAFSKGGKYITGVVFDLDSGDAGEIGAKMEEMLARRFEKQPMDMPSAGSTFKRPEGAFASALIDGCGLKGYSVGGAQVSSKHAGFVVNTGNATYGDVLHLMDDVKKRVLKETGFVLEPEVEIWKVN